MTTTILSTLLPVIITLLLGFVAAWRRDFDSRDAGILNRMVLMAAVPLAVFVGTVSTSRADLAQSIPLVVGAPVIVHGTKDASGLMRAEAIMHAKPDPALWPADR